MATISHFSNAGNFSITNSSLTFISNSNVDVIQEDLRMFLLDQLGPSHIADHKFCLVGEKREVLRRATCTPGTRIAILASIIKWANDTSAESQDIYWLFGPAGSGKSTIAYTIARRFELAIEVEDTIFLGGNFFCSRQFEDTKYETYIVRTIVYHLALRCKAFADALRCSGKFDTVHRSVRAQLQDLLVGPWLESESTCEDPPSRRYLIVIDALDEIDQQGGSAFLRDLLDVIKDNHLLGLKFFFTSRQDPGLVDQVESFTRKRLYRLQDVEKEEVEADITTYLAVRLPHFKDRDEMKKLVTFTSGLFICAATLIKYLSPHKLTPREQSTLLRRLLPDSVIPQPPSKATDLLDALYHQILSDAFSHLDGDILQERLQILHTFLCTPERTSTSIIANLLSSGSDETDSVWSFTEVADAVLSSLHAVLYTDTDNHVLSYHKSFSDFMFDCRRSKEYWCDQTPLHHHLTESCFRVMNAGLKFNIANIPSSFIFDSENHALRNEAERNIPPTLSYACRNWSHHLSATVPTAVDPLLVTLSTFLELRVLFWIEAMNLLGFRGLCDPILQTAREWIANVDPEVAQQLTEAASFAAYFSGSSASLSTPHLYISSLVTWPRDANPCQKWRAHFPRLPGFTRRSQSGLQLMTLAVGSSVHAVALSRDRTRIVSGSEDGLVSVWDASIGKIQGVLKGHTNVVTSVAFSSDGRWIVSGSYDNSVRVWNASTGQVQDVLEGHTSPVTSVAFSRDGACVVSGSWDKSLRVWDASTGRVQRMLEGHTDWVTSVAFSSDGKHIVSGSEDTSVRVWDASIGELRNAMDGHTYGVTSVAFSSDGTRIVSGSYDNSVRIWDASTGVMQNVLEGHTDWVTSVAFSSDGSRIISGSEDRSVRVWDASTGHPQNVLEGHTNWVTSVVLSSDGSRIVSGSEDGSVRVWDATISKGQRVVDDHANGVTSVALSCDGRWIVSGSYDNLVRVWDGSNGEVRHVLAAHTKLVTSVAFSSDGRQIVSGSWDKLVRVWDATTGELQNVLEGHTSGIASVAFSADRRRILSASSENSVMIWDALTGELENALEGHSYWITAVAFSSDGSRVISCSEGDNSLKVWDPSSREVQHVLEGHTGLVTSLAFSSDRRQIVSGSLDQSVMVWDASTGELRTVLEGHVGGVASVAFSRDGRWIVSGSDDKSVRVWDASTGKLRNVLEGHTDWVTSVAFSSDGSRIISGSEDGSVRVWDASAEDVPCHSDTSPTSCRKGHCIDTRLVIGPGQSSVTDPRYIQDIEVYSTGIQRYKEWLLSPDGNDKLIFVPPDARLPTPRNILTIPRSACSYVHLNYAALGAQWLSCYLP